MTKMYLVRYFKKIESTGEVYGAKTFVGNLDRCCKRLIKKYGFSASVKTLGPGRYSIADGEAELEIR